MFVQTTQSTLYRLKNYKLLTLQRLNKLNYYQNHTITSSLLTLHDLCVSVFTMRNSNFLCLLIIFLGQISIQTLDLYMFKPLSYSVNNQDSPKGILTYLRTQNTCQNNT